MNCLITGGAGSFGRQMVESLLSNDTTEKVVIYSRDEYKHATMQREVNDSRLRFIVGDVRNTDRLRSALNGIDVAIHAAAMKRIEVCEYNPSECVDVNVNGTQSFIEACVGAGVSHAVLISTDKAVSPINLYGASKMACERLFLAANVYQPIFNVVRYGNVMRSRGSVVNYFSELVSSGVERLPVTSPNMTRFCMQYEQAIDLVYNAIIGIPQVIYVAKAPSYSLVRLCAAFGKDWELVGKRPGEKLHETLVGEHEIERAFDYGSHIRVYPETPADSDIRIPATDHLNIPYDSYNNPRWLSIEELRSMI